MSTKMKTIRRRIIPGIIFLSALLMSCKFAIIDDIVTAQKSGTLKVTVSMEGTSMKSAERTVVPSITLNAARYEIVCTNSGGTVIASTTLSSLADYTFTNIVPGAITVSIKAYNASSMLIASGSAAVTVSESAPAAANVELKLAKTAGVTSGSIALQIQWPAASATAISWYLDGSDPADLQLAPVISDAGGGMSKATLSAANLTSVVHTVRIYFMNASINQRTGTQLELVNVYDNMTSDSWVNADGTLSDKKVYTTSEAMSMAQSQGTDATVRILAGDTLQTISLTSGTTSITLPNVITTDSITVIPSTGVTGQSLAYSLNEVPYTPIASDSPVILSPPSGGIFSTLDLRVTAPDTGTSTVYSLRIRSPVHVTNQADLITALGTLDNNIVLDNSISLTGTWIPIGSSTTPFTGTFDGNGKTISGLTIDDQLGTYPQAGMFANVGSSATIKNLHLTGVNVFGNATGQMGGLAGVNGGTIFRCSSSGNVTESNQISTGGLIGQNYGTGTVSECWSNATVTGIYYAGGLVGANDGLIINSYARGVVSAVWGGGLAGSNNPGGIIRNSYAAGSVISNGTETNPSFGFLQGLIGNSGGTITNSYFDLSKIATTYKAGAIITSGYFGTAESTSAMRDLANTATNYPGWDFSSVWIIDPGKNGGYPILRAMPVPDDVILPTGLITTAMLQSQFTQLDGNYILNGSITLTDSVPWTPIGSATPFTGTFDGKGNTISGLTIISSPSAQAGMFANVGTGAIIENLHLTEVKISGNQVTGGLAGINYGTISRCSSTGTVTFSPDYVTGGLIGANFGTVSECWSNATVTASFYSGGLVGANKNIIINSYALGTVVVVWGGGLLGSNDTGNVQNCYAAGLVSPNGAVAGDPSGYLQELIGKSDPSAKITSCFFDVSKIATSYLAGVITTGYFGTPATDRTTLNTAVTSGSSGWDFTNIWAIDGTNGGYPHLIHNLPTP